MSWDRWAATSPGPALPLLPARAPWGSRFACSIRKILSGPAPLLASPAIVTRRAAMTTLARPMRSKARTDSLITNVAGKSSPLPRRLVLSVVWPFLLTRSTTGTAAATMKRCTWGSIAPGKGSRGEWAITTRNLPIMIKRTAPGHLTSIFRWVARWRTAP